MASKEFKEILKKAVDYLHTPEGIKEFRKSRERALFLQDLMHIVKLESKKEVFDDIENKWLYKRDKKVYGQRFIVTIGETRWKELKKKHLHKVVKGGK